MNPNAPTNSQCRRAFLFKVLFCSSTNNRPPFSLIYREVCIGQHDRSAVLHLRKTRYGIRLLQLLKAMKRSKMQMKGIHQVKTRTFQKG